VLFRGVFGRVFSDERMDQVFRDHKERQVESEVVFSSLIDLVTPVVSGGKPSVHASYQERQEQMGVASDTDVPSGKWAELFVALICLISVSKASTASFNSDISVCGSSAGVSPSWTMAFSASRWRNDSIFSFRLLRSSSASANFIVLLLSVPTLANQ
jgi:hypothetical protein